MTDRNLPGTLIHNYEMMAMVLALGVRYLNSCGVSKGWHKRNN